jgi:SAM-dependent methyltransferase
VIVRLDFGGEAKRAHALRLAQERGPGVAIVARLGDRLPFRDSSVDEIFLDHALAHAEDFLSTIEECWRVSRRGALIHVRLPHASSSWGVSRDPRHFQHFTLETFNYFDPRLQGAASCVATTAKFRVEHARLYLRGGRRNGAGPGGGAAKIVEGVANRSRGMQYRWERWFAPLFGGFEEFYVVLSTIKEAPLG